MNTKSVTHSDSHTRVHSVLRIDCGNIAVLKALILGDRIYNPMVIGSQSDVKYEVFILSL